MADEAPTQPVVQVVTASQTPPLDPTAVMQALVDSDKTRKLLVKLLFAVFGLSITGIAASAVFKGWEVSGTGNAILIMILQAEIAAIATVVNYYFGSSQGSAMKSM